MAINQSETIQTKITFQLANQKRNNHINIYYILVNAKSDIILYPVHSSHILSGGDSMVLEVRRRLSLQPEMGMGDVAWPPSIEGTNIDPEKNNVQV